MYIDLCIYMCTPRRYSGRSVSPIPVWTASGPICMCLYIYICVYHAGIQVCPRRPSESERPAVPAAVRVVFNVQLVRRDQHVAHRLHVKTEKKEVSTCTIQTRYIYLLTHAYIWNNVSPPHRNRKEWSEYIQYKLDTYTYSHTNTNTCIYMKLCIASISKQKGRTWVHAIQTQYVYLLTQTQLHA